MDATRLDDEMREQVAEVVDPNATEPFGVYVWADPNPAASLARHVERVVFDEASAIHPSSSTSSTAKYERSSLFLCVIDHRRRLPVGMARAILPSDAGLKSLNDIEREWGEDVDDVLARTGLHDAARARLGLRHASRRCRSTERGDTHGVISMALYQTLATATLRCGFRWCGGDDRRAGAPACSSGASAARSRPMRECAAMPYLGSTASMPVWSDLPAWSARLATSNPVKHEIMFGGHGLAGRSRAARLGCGRGAGRRLGRAPAR